VALAYRRRAAELELEAEVLDEKLVRYTPTERVSEIESVVAAA